MKILVKKILVVFLVVLMCVSSIMSLAYIVSAPASTPKPIPANPSDDFHKLLEKYTIAEKSVLRNKEGESVKRTYSGDKTPANYSKVFSMKDIGPSGDQILCIILKKGETGKRETAFKKDLIALATKWKGDFVILNANVPNNNELMECMDIISDAMDRYPELGIVECGSRLYRGQAGVLDEQKTLSPDYRKKDNKVGVWVGFEGQLESSIQAFEDKLGRFPFVVYELGVKEYVDE